MKSAQQNENTDLTAETQSATRADKVLDGHVGGCHPGAMRMVIKIKGLPAKSPAGRREKQFVRI